MNPVWLSPVIGGIIGLGTNWLAVRMLFRPYRELRLFGCTIVGRGLIPANQARLAIEIGRVIEQDILTREGILARLEDPESTRALMSVLSEAVDALAGKPLPPLMEMIPAERHEDVERLLADLAEKAAIIVRDLIATPETESVVQALLSQHIRPFLNRPLGEWVSDTVRDILETAMIQFLQDLGRADSMFPTLLGKTLRETLERETRSLTEILPTSAHFTVYDELTRFIPYLIDLLESQLTKPETAERIREVLVDTIGKAVFSREGREDDSLIERLMGGTFRRLGRLLPDEFRRSLIENAVSDPTPYLRETLHSPEFRDTLETMLQQAWTGVVRVPLNTWPGLIRSDTREQITDLWQDLARRMLEDPGSQSTIHTLVHNTLQQAFRSTAASLLRDPETALNAMTGELLTMTRSLTENPVTLSTLKQAVHHWLCDYAKRSPGTLQRWLKPHTRQVMLDLVFSRIMIFLRDNLPALMQAVDVRQIVRERVEGLSPAEMETMVKRVADRELKWITILGGVLGFLVGIGQALLTVWLGQI